MQFFVIFCLHQSALHANPLASMVKTVLVPWRSHSAMCFELARGCRPQVTGCQLQATSYRLQAAGYKLQATGCRLQAAGCKLQATGYKLQATGYKLPKIHIFTTAKRREVSYGPHCTVGAVTRVPSQIHCICTELGVTGTWDPLPHEAHYHFRAVHRHLNTGRPQPVGVNPPRPSA